MIDTYWDFYIAYIAKCVRENDANGLDPEHYYMEWNHWLPRCLFKGHGPGHWLTLKQHAIASALQTLGLKENCMTGMMKKYLPEKLLELAWPYYCLAQSEKMKLRTGELNTMFGKTGELSPHFGKKRPDVSERMKLQTGELHPMFGRTGELHPLFGRTGELCPWYGKKNPAQSERMSGEGNPMRGKTGKLNHSYGKKWWVNREGKTYKGVEAPDSNWKRGRKWKD